MIAIIDYGVGNLASVNKAFSFIGHDSKITSDHDEILSADGVVLPGVGAFADAMDSLETTKMIPIIKKVAASGKPLLGICLGMQLLFDSSTEGAAFKQTYTKSPRYLEQNLVKGLGLLKGTIQKFPSTMNLKVPHMGWNSIQIKNNKTIFKGIPENSCVYFVHSYFLTSEDKSDVAATSGYGIEFHAAVSHGNIMGTQFHPEKSGDVGLSILRNFACMCV